jgi:hypothetical protein
LVYERHATWRKKKATTRHSTVQSACRVREREREERKSVCVGERERECRRM